MLRSVLKIIKFKAKNCVRIFIPKRKQHYLKLVLENFLVQGKEELSSHQYCSLAHGSHNEHSLQANR